MSVPKCDDCGHFLIVHPLYTHGRCLAWKSAQYRCECTREARLVAVPYEPDA